LKYDDVTNNCGLICLKHTCSAIVKLQLHVRYCGLSLLYAVKAILIKDVA